MGGELSDAWVPQACLAGMAPARDCAPALRPARAASASFLALCVKRDRSPLPAALCRRAAPLGPMPNEDIDVSNLEALEKYRSFTRYFRLAEKESRKPRWWKTYRQHTSPPAGTPGRSCTSRGFVAEGQGSCRWGHGFAPKPAP